MNESFYMNLQLFAEEKTEKATPKKRKDARERGQVLKSVEVNSAVSLLVMLGVLKLFSPYMLSNMQRAYTDYFTMDTPHEELFTGAGLNTLSIDIIIRVFFILAPVLSAAFIAGLVVNYGQVGFLFTAKTLAVRMDRINPLQGFKRIFSARAFMDLLKSMIKLAIIGGIVYSEFIKSTKSVPNLSSQQLNLSIAFIADAFISISFKTAIALLVMAAFDYLYQWWDHEKNLMMTKQEIKEEFKQSEGDPQIKSKIKARQREMGMRRMMQAVPSADVVITNPTHFAIALKYDNAEDDAPRVVAKGQDHVAQKIKELAKESNVAMVENKPLAQALYKSTEIGNQIPEELFQAVAEVLAFVYSLKNKR